MLQEILKDKVSSMKKASAEDLLAALGLERHRSWVEIIGTHAAVLATGMILGAGIALLTAPKSGRALRHEIKTKASEFAKRVGKETSEATTDFRSALLPEGTDKQRAPQQQSNGEEISRPRT